MYLPIRTLESETQLIEEYRSLRVGLLDIRHTLYASLNSVIRCLHTIAIALPRNAKALISLFIVC